MRFLLETLMGKFSSWANRNALGWAMIATFLDLMKSLPLKNSLFINAKLIFVM